MKIIAIIPARDNSKRIKNKNLLKINKKPVLKINFTNLKKMKLFDKIILSTESKRIKKLAKKIKFDYIIDRPKKLAKDHVSTTKVISHGIEFLKDKIDFTHVCCVYPMSILLKKKDILNAKKILKRKNEIVFSSLRYSHPIQRAFKILKDHRIKYNIKENLIFKNTQLFDTSFHDAGQFYIGHHKAWKDYRNSKKKSLELPRTRAVDVDDFEDFKLLEAIYNYNHN